MADPTHLHPVNLERKSLFHWTRSRIESKRNKNERKKKSKKRRGNDQTGPSYQEEMPRLFFACQRNGKDLSRARRYQPKRNGMNLSLDKNGGTINQWKPWQANRYRILSSWSKRKMKKNWNDEDLFFSAGVIPCSVVWSVTPIKESAFSKYIQRTIRPWMIWWMNS